MYGDNGQPNASVEQAYEDEDQRKEAAQERMEAAAMKECIAEMNMALIEAHAAVQKAISKTDRVRQRQEDKEFRNRDHKDEMLIRRLYLNRKRLYKALGNVGLAKTNAARI